MTVQVGDTAPDFALFDQNRKLRRLGEFTGAGKAVLAFFPGAFTGVCTKEMCAFRDSLGKLPGSVVGISVDGVFSLAEFASKNGITFPLLSDHTKQTIKAYGVEFPDFAGVPGYLVARRSVFVVGTDGKVRYQWLAPQPSVEPDYAAVEKALQ